MPTKSLLSVNILHNAVKLEAEVLFFSAWNKREEFGKNNPRRKDQDKTQAQLTYGTGSEKKIGPHWWQVNIFKTTPSLLLLTMKMFY